MTCPPASGVFLLACACFTVRAATFQGKVTDPSGAAVPGARVAAVNRVGVVFETATDSAGAFQISVPDAEDTQVLVTAPGFEMKTVPLAQNMTVTLAIAAQNDSITVAGSSMDVPLSQQGSSAGIIPSEEIGARNEAQAIDLIRYLPGLSVTTTGSRGSLTSLFIRGGDYNFNLVTINGVPIDWFGGIVDFAHIPTDFLDHIEVVRGPQSAVYGAYANGGVVNFVTRQPEGKAEFEALAEGGSHDERRFALGGSGMLQDLGIGVFLSELDDNGPVSNSDYHDKNAFLTVTRNFGRQSMAADGSFNASEVGQPGPYGSDPEHLFTGIDLISRNRFNRSVYGGHYQIDVTPRVRQEVFAGLFWNNAYYISPYGDSYENDYRGQLEERTVVNFTPHYTAAFGYVFSREEVKNTFITDASANAFPLQRNQQGIYWENRFVFGRRLFVNAGAREEIIRTSRIAADPGVARPEFPADTILKLNPKAAVAYALREGTRLHASAGTGIRPPSGFELAFTNNPRLKPERTASGDVGIEQRLLHNRVSLDATYFYNRYYDLIVVLGGSLTHLSSFQSDNLANSRAQGGEFSAGFRPARWISVTGAYTLLDSEILSLSGSTHLAPQYFAVGQPLERRPRHSGTMVATMSRGRLSANVTGYFRGSDLDVEPNFGPAYGLFYNPGYANFGLNVNWRLGHGVTLYGNLRNALNWHYEEAFGYPSPLLNFVSGVKWTFSPGH
ncbi:MAG TPA: TonB-dependent receptor [Bryobacteraceae bacterium]|nr:TonB-dependent receptor [Bryobacteraceae bacterium]